MPIKVSSRPPTPQETKELQKSETEIEVRDYAQENPKDLSESVIKLVLDSEEFQDVLRDCVHKSADFTMTIIERHLQDYHKPEKPWWKFWG